MEDLLDFQRRQTVGARVAVGSVTKTDTFIRYIQSSSFQAYDGINKSWEVVIS